MALHKANFQREHEKAVNFFSQAKHSFKFFPTVSIKEKVTSTRSPATKRAATRKTVIPSQPNTTTTSARRAPIKRAVIIMTTSVISMKTATMSTTDIRKNMAKRAAQITARNGEARREKVTKANVFLM